MAGRVAVVDRVIAAPPEQVFEVLADGWTYSDWVVGTAHIRDVDATWPEPGARIHHSSGPWPLSIRDATTAVECEPPHRLVLRAGLWPLGEAVVRFDLHPIGAAATRLVIHEDFTAGLLRWAHTRFSDMLMHLRNREVLRRFADLATRKESTGRPPGWRERRKAEPVAEVPEVSAQKVVHR